MTMKQHITYFDFLRGVAILMVLGIHTYVDGDFTSLDGTLKILFRQILNCAVPVFLALSAFFLGRKTFENRDSVLFFWKKQIPKVYIPCMVWSLPLLVILILEGGNILELICKMIVCGLSVYYFIALIIQYYLLLPFLQKHLKRNLIVAIISSVIAVFNCNLFALYQRSNHSYHCLCRTFPCLVRILHVGSILFTQRKRLFIAISMDSCYLWFNFGIC